MNCFLRSYAVATAKGSPPLGKESGHIERRVPTKEESQLQTTLSYNTERSLCKGRSLGIHNSSKTCSLGWHSLLTKAGRWLCSLCADGGAER